MVPEKKPVDHPSIGNSNLHLLSTQALKCVEWLPDKKERVEKTFKITIFLLTV